METSIFSRSFNITPALRAAIEAEADEFGRKLAQRHGRLTVRLYDVNGTRGGVDKVCVLQGNLGRERVALVASEIDSDAYRAIAGAFAKLERAARSAMCRSRARVRRDNHAARG